MALLIFTSNTLIAQYDKSSSKKKNNDKVSYGLISINYISDAVFMGRKDSISAPYLYPSILYHHKSGLYAKGSFSYLTKANESRIDLFLLTAGVDFSVNDFSGDLSVTKYFFNNDSYNVISDVQADLTASLDYDFNVVNLSVSASSYFNKNSNADFFLSSEVSHDFSFSNDKFQISPTVGAYLGSQNFYEEYYINSKIRSGAGNGSGSSGTITDSTIAIQEGQKFNIMAYELSMPMWYTENSFIISFIPAVVFPQNEATLLIDETTVIEENLKETFYWVVGLTYTF
jgi:hypothetical protein